MTVPLSRLPPPVSFTHSLLWDILGCFTNNPPHVHVWVGGTCTVFFFAFLNEYIVGVFLIKACRLD